MLILKTYRFSHEGFSSWGHKSGHVFLRIGRNGQLTLGTMILCFVDTHVLQSRAHGLSANVVSNHFDDNMTLIMLLLERANLRRHILLASFAESDSSW